jgi:hypothetical protein
VMLWRSTSRRRYVRAMRAARDAADRLPP